MRLITKGERLMITLLFAAHNQNFNGKRNLMNTTVAFKTYMCLICGWVYDEEAGLPEEGIPPGTRWDDVPPNWVCPECGARKEDFELVEI